MESVVLAEAGQQASTGQYFEPAGQSGSKRKLDWLDQLCYLGAAMGLLGVLLNTLTSLLT